MRIGDYMEANGAEDFREILRLFNVLRSNINNFLLNADDFHQRTCGYFDNFNNLDKIIQNRNNRIASLKSEENELQISIKRKKSEIADLEERKNKRKKRARK